MFAELSLFSVDLFTVSQWMDFHIPTLKHLLLTLALSSISASEEASEWVITHANVISDSLLLFSLSWWFLDSNDRQPLVCVHNRCKWYLGDREFLAFFSSSSPTLYLSPTSCIDDQDQNRNHDHTMMMLHTRRKYHLISQTSTHCDRDTLKKGEQASE